MGGPQTRCTQRPCAQPQGTSAPGSTSPVHRSELGASLGAISLPASSEGAGNRSAPESGECEGRADLQLLQCSRRAMVQADHIFNQLVKRACGCGGVGGGGGVRLKK